MSTYSTVLRRALMLALAAPLLLRVIAALRTMTCRKPEMTALASFYDAWMLEVQGRQG